MILSTGVFMPRALSSNRRTMVNWGRSYGASWMITIFVNRSR